MKNIRIISLCVIICLFLAACGGAADNSAAQGSKDTSAAGKNDDAQPSSDATDNAQTPPTENSAAQDTSGTPTATVKITGKGECYGTVSKSISFGLFGSGEATFDLSDPEYG